MCIRDSYLIASHADGTDLPYIMSKRYMSNNGMAFSKSNDFQKRVYAFLTRDFDKDNPIQKTAILVGGLGTGKSTFLWYEKTKLKQFHEKTESQYALINVDFSTFHDEISRDEAGKDKYRDKVYRSICEQLRKSIDDNNISHMSEEEEVTLFWNWCLKKYDLLQESNILSSHLSRLECKIKDSLEKEELATSLKEEKSHLFVSLQNDSHANMFYIFLKLIYFLENKQYERRYMFLDNLDHLLPDLQKEIVHLALRIGNGYNFRTLVSIRPLTAEKCFHGHRNNIVIEHCSPDIMEVINSRIEVIARKYSEKYPEFTHDVKKISKLLERSKGNPLRKYLIRSSGLSVRLALRQFHNFILSPIIKDEAGRINTNKRVSEIIHAFIYGKDGADVNHNFENIYSVSGSINTHTITLKSRILYYLAYLKNGESQLVDLYEYLKLFYRQDIRASLINSLNELMYRPRPLLWVQGEFEVSNAESYQRIRMTHIGVGYIRSLFGELSYDEACISNGMYQRDGAAFALAHHKEFAESDFRESQYHALTYGLDSYKMSLSNDRQKSLSHIHWSRLARALQNRNTPHYDANRESWLDDMYSNLGIRG